MRAKDGRGRGAVPRRTSRFSIAKRLDSRGRADNVAKRADGVRRDASRRSRTGSLQGEGRRLM